MILDEQTASARADGADAALLQAMVRRGEGMRWAAPLCLLTFAVCYLTFRQFPWLFAGGGSRNGANHFAMILFAAVPALAVLYYAPRLLLRSARRLFAEKVLRPIGLEVDAAMTLEPEKRVSGKTLDASLLFDSAGSGITTLQGENLFRGTVGRNSFEFSALDADKTIQHGCHLVGGTLFSGLFLRVDSREGRSGMVIAVPRASGLTLEGMAERLEALDMDDRPPLVEAEIVHDPEFDRWFIVFATREEAPAALSREARARMSALREHYPCQPYFSRIDGVCCLGLLTGRSHLELTGAKLAGKEGADRECRRFHDDIVLMRQLAAEPCWW